MLVNFLKSKGTREILCYGVVGMSVTALNMVLYYVFTRYTSIHYMVATVTSFVLANIYAFFANKLFVFQSRSFAWHIFWKEAVGFFTARGASCLIDLVIMYIGVDFLHIQDMFVKIFSSIVVIILNYVASKFIIFAKKGER